MESGRLHGSSIAISPTSFWALSNPSVDFVYNTASTPTRHEYQDHGGSDGCIPRTIMEKWKGSKFARWSEKLAVDNESELTTAQLML